MLLSIMTQNLAPVDVTFVNLILAETDTSKVTTWITYHQLCFGCKHLRMCLKRMKVCNSPVSPDKTEPRKENTSEDA